MLFMLDVCVGMFKAVLGAWEASAFQKDLQEETSCPMPICNLYTYCGIHSCENWCIFAM